MRGSGKEQSIKDIAKKAGVGTSTISRVLNKTGYVSEETRNKVEQAIRECHYTPSVMARGLKGSKLPGVGVVIPDITGEFYSGLVLNLQQELMKWKYQMLIINTNKQRKATPLYESISGSMNLSGWIFCGSDEKNAEQSTPTVYVNPISRSILRDAYTVSSQEQYGGWLATKTLLEGGCRKIVFITDGRYNLSDNSRLDGYRQALAEAGIARDEELVFPTKWVDYENGYRATMEILRRRPDIDGIFCTADRYLPGTLSALDELGKHVPQDIQVVGYDDTPTSLWCGGGCTTIHQELAEIAKAAVGTLMALLAGDQPEVLATRIPVRLVRRATTL